MRKRAVENVLISGASIAGPALAYWLTRYGIKATVVERAAALRGGGYAIDIRGTALDAVTRMGLLVEAQTAHIHREEILFLDVSGQVFAKLTSEAISGGRRGVDVELCRGDLAKMLFDVTRDTVRYKFNNSIRSLSETGRGVDVVFANGDRETFDIVVGADGLHSNTRALIFGHESQFEKYIGFCFAGFSVPDKFGLRNETVLWNAPGRAAVISATGPGRPAIGMLTFKYPTSPFREAISEADQRELTAKMFPETDWLVPELVKIMRSADDLFFDSVSQIHMPSWSKGRIVLAGDAAHATSFLSGQGSSMALVGAYVLAGELATKADYGVAFSEYERIARPFIEMNQALVTDGGTMMIPITPEALDERNAMLKAASERPQGTGEPGEASRPVHSALKLPAYDVAA